MGIKEFAFDKVFNAFIIFLFLLIITGIFYLLRYVFLALFIIAIPEILGFLLLCVLWCIDKSISFGKKLIDII